MSETADYAAAWAAVGTVVIGVAGCVSCLNNPVPGGQFPMTPFNLFSGAILGAVIGAVVGAAVGYHKDIELREKNGELRAIRERERIQAEANAKATAHAKALVELRHMTVESQRIASSLPVILSEVEIALDRAEYEFASGLYSPFWEAMDNATALVQSFDHALTSLKIKRMEYLEQASGIGREAPPFSIGVTVLPDPANTRQRMIALYRQAQKDRYFAIVYEQRRTNEILTAGFRSLGQAIEGLTDRVADAIRELSVSLDCRLVSLESSLESTAAVAQNHNEALLTELKHAHRSTSDAVIRQLRDDADARSEDRRVALRMLDNIQRHRKPTA